MGATDQEIIDAYLGEDTYDNWMDLQRRLRVAVRRNENTIKKLVGVYDNGLSFRVDLAEHLNFDYETGMHYILQGKNLDINEVQDVGTLFELALDTIEAEMDLIEAVQMSGFAAWMLFPFALFAAKAGILKQQLEELKKLLDKAKQELKEAKIQKALDVGITIATLLLPELGVVEKFVVGAGKLTYDHFLGPKSPDARKVGKTTFTTYSSSVKKIKSVGETSGQVISTTGKVVKYYGVVFDWDEILEGYKNVDQIEAAMKATQKAYDFFIGEIKKSESQLLLMEMQFKKAEAAIQDYFEEVQNLIDILDDEIKAIHYSSPKAWRFLP